MHNDKCNCDYCFKIGGNPEGDYEMPPEEVMPLSKAEIENIMRSIPPKPMPPPNIIRTNCKTHKALLQIIANSMASAFLITAAGLNVYSGNWLVASSFGVAAGATTLMAVMWYLTE